MKFQIFSHPGQKIVSSALSEVATPEGGKVLTSLTIRYWILNIDNRWFNTIVYTVRGIETHTQAQIFKFYFGDCSRIMNACQSWYLGIVHPPP